MALPATTGDGSPTVAAPPAGVHVPGPSFRPLLASIDLRCVSDEQTKTNVEAFIEQIAEGR